MEFSEEAVGIVVRSLPLVADSRRKRSDQSSLVRSSGLLKLAYRLDEGMLARRGPALHSLEGETWGFVGMEIIPSLIVCWRPTIPMRKNGTQYIVGTLKLWGPRLRIEDCAFDVKQPV